MSRLTPSSCKGELPALPRSRSRLADSLARGSDAPLFQAEETQTSSSVATESGLSVGVKVGLGVGISLAALLFFGAVVFFLLGRKKRIRAGSEEGPRPPDEMGPNHSPNRTMEISELHQSSRPLPQSQFQQFGSVDYNTPHQLRADKSPIEMPSDTTPQ